MISPPAMRCVSSRPPGITERTSLHSKIVCDTKLRHVCEFRQGAAAAAVGVQAAARQGAVGDAVQPPQDPSHPTQNEPIEAIIADVLNANKAQLQRPSDLLSLIDSTGHGISTVVRRSWDTTAVRLSLEGTWSKCAEARKMAMLAVYQERLVFRAGGLLRAMRWVEAQQPGLLDSSVVQQVEKLAAADDINPAVQVLMVPQLTLLAAGIYPWPVLLKVVETAVAAAQQVLLSKPPYNYSPAKQKTAQQQLQWVEASLCRGAALARLRSLLLQQGRLQHWQQQADAAAAGAGAALQGLTAEQAYHEWWKQQPLQQQEQRQVIGTATAGRQLIASFHRMDSSKQWQQQAAPGAAVSAASAAGDWDVAAAAAEQQQVCCSITQLTERVKSLKQEMGATEGALGVLPEVQNAHRSALLDLLVSWSDASPATQGPTEPAAVQARVAISSIEHDRLLRRIALEASGAETKVLRHLARSKGRDFLAHFSPTVGNPFGNTPEWDYFRDCPGVFARFVVDPPTNTAILTFKQQDNVPQPARQQQQQPGSGADTEVVLSGSELQQLQQELLLVLSGSSSTKAANNNNGSRSISLRPLSSSSSSSSSTATSSSSSSSRARGGAAAGGLELLVDGAVAAVLQPVHVMSLVTVFDDLGGQLPQQYSTSRQTQGVQVTPAPAWGAAVSSATATLQSAARAAAAAALLALPLIAMARPFRARHMVPPSAAATTTAVTVSTITSTSPAAAEATAEKSAVLLNDSLSAADMQRLCSALQQRINRRVWLSIKDAQVDESTAASILGGSIGRTGSSDTPRRSSTGSSDKLMFQVVLCVSGRVLGVSPCTPEAAAVVWELPIAVDVRGPQLAKVHERRAKAIAEAIHPTGKPVKKPPTPSSQQLSYNRALQQPLPADQGVAVLRLLLTPTALQDQASAVAAAPAGAVPAAAEEGGDAADSSAAAVDQQQGQQQQQQRTPGVVVFGSGKASTSMWLMQAEVTPWSDDDSLKVWASRGAALQQDQQQQQMVAGGSSGGSSSGGVQAGAAAQGGGMSLTVDGQEVQSMEAFVQQLIALSQQAQQAQQQQ